MATKALRVVSYNVQRWGRLDTIIDTLARLRPDVLCLQECCQKRGAGALQKVADACGLKQVHFFGHTMDESYGNAILTRCLLYTSPSPRDRSLSRMPSSA